MEDNIRKQIYLAALLHDIGKFYQRASNKSIREIKPDYVKEEFGYQHADWTFEFFKIDKIKTALEKIPELKQNLYENTSENQFNIVNLASNHHRPQSMEEAFVTMGDWWSAGIDRTDVKTIKEKNFTGKPIGWGNDRYKTLPLFSVFNTLKNGKGNRAFKLNALNNDTIFPVEIKEKADGVNQEEYAKLWDKFIQEFQQLPTDSLEGFTESLIFLLKKHTWCIPSNTMDMANVSLFEHLKTTAAFADSLSVYQKAKNEAFTWNASDKRLVLNEEQFPVIILGVDISGIQKFIYNIASSKAAKSLKGRSFYLQLLIDSMVQQIITHPKINATIGHVIYSSGGKFYMILPNTDGVKEALAQLKGKFEKELWQEHKGKISVNFGYTGFAYRTKKENNKWNNWIEIESLDGKKELNDLWKFIADKINIEKNKPFQSVLLEKWDEFFDEGNGNLHYHETRKICAVTGEELNEDNLKVLDTDADGNKIYVSKAVYEQTELGTALKDIDYIITYRNPKDESNYLNNRSHAHIKVLGTDHYLFDKIELTKNKTEFRKISSADISRVIRINKAENFLVGIGGKKISYGFQFYGGNEQAYLRDKNGEVITKKRGSNADMFEKKKEKLFEDLAKTEYDEQTYLGILRMDIDNLGNIFINGFDKEERSFAGYATLSFLLDLFFSGYLNTIRNSEKYKDWVNILYSGGDDIFAVGRWDKLIEFAKDIRKSFSIFTGREDITISAGMATVRNKFPIAKAAELAGDAEEAAKNYPKARKEKLKNAFTFLGETISWNDEFDFVKKYKDMFINKIQTKNIPKAILHRLMQFDEIKKENERRKNEDKYKPDLSYKWNTAYYLKRFSQRHKQENNFIMNDLMIKLFADKERNYDLIALACRWAELEVRNKVKSVEK